MNLLLRAQRRLTRNAKKLIVFAADIRASFADLIDPTTGPPDDTEEEVGCYITREGLTGPQLLALLAVADAVHLLIYDDVSGGFMLVAHLRVAAEDIPGENPTPDLKILEFDSKQSSVKTDS